MEKLEIGEVILRLRKQKGLTQEQLANFVGVSTPAVSKWESGISYPDITMLPVLARFFSVTIDEILDYKKSLTDEEVNNILIECQNEFNNKGLEQGICLCEKYINKHYSNYSLKLSISSIITLQYVIEKGEEGSKESFERTREIYEDVIKNCNDTKLVQMALVQLGTGYFSLKDNENALKMFNKIEKVDLDVDNMIAMVYISEKKFEEARKMLQYKLLKNINEILLSISNISQSYVEDDLSLAEKYMKLLNDISNVFEKEGLNNLSIGSRINLIQFYAKNQSIQKCQEEFKVLINLIKEDKLSLEVDNSVWFLSELNLESQRELQISLPKVLITMLEGEEFKFINKLEEYKEIMRLLKEYI